MNYFNKMQNYSNPKSRIMPFKIISNPSTSNIYTTSRQEIIVRSPKPLQARVSVFSSPVPTSPVMRSTKSFSELQIHKYIPSMSLSPKQSDNLNKIQSLRYIYQKPQPLIPLTRKGTTMYFDTEPADDGTSQAEDSEVGANMKSCISYSKIFETNGSKPRSCENCIMFHYEDSIIIASGNSSSLYIETLILDLASKQFRKVKSEKPPKNRNGFSMSCYKEKVLIYGGWETTSGLKRKMSRKMRIFDFVKGKWEKNMGIGAIPSPRKNHAFSQLGQNMLVYGGEDFQGITRSELFVLDMKTLNWTEGDYAVSSTSVPRSHATLTAVFHKCIKKNENFSILKFPSFKGKFFIKNSGFYLFGGLNARKQPCNDLNGLFIRNDKFLWASVNTTGVSPPPRYSHSACAVHCSLFIFAGRNDEVGQAMNDLYCINLNNFKWEKVEVAGSVPAARWGHSMVDIDSVILIFGGLTYRQFMPTDIYSIETRRLQVEESLKLQRKVSLV